MLSHGWWPLGGVPGGGDGAATMGGAVNSGGGGGGFARIGMNGAIRAPG
jgi:hypothetical protein